MNKCDFIAFSGGKKLFDENWSQMVQYYLKITSLFDFMTIINGCLMQTMQI